MNEREYREMFTLEDTYWWFVGRRAIIRRLLRQLPGGGEHRRVLDLGCGTGANALMFTEFGSVIGLDVGSEALRLAATRPSAAWLTEGVATRLPFRSQTFDLVACLDVLEHVADDLGALRETRRVLKQNGRLVMTVPAFSWLWSEHDEALGHFRRYSHGELLRVLRSAGLLPELTNYAICLPLIPAVILRLMQNLVRRPDRQAQTKHLLLPSTLNRLLIRYLEFEGRLVHRHRLPFGVSLVALARPAEQLDTTPPIP